MDEASLVATSFLTAVCARDRRRLTAAWTAPNLVTAACALLAAVSVLAVEP